MISIDFNCQPFIDTEKLNIYENKSVFYLWLDLNIIYRIIEKTIDYYGDIYPDEILTIENEKYRTSLINNIISEYVKIQCSSDFMYLKEQIDILRNLNNKYLYLNKEYEPKSILNKTIKVFNNMGLDIKINYKHVEKCNLMKNY